jgi:predicted aspartyl protease
MNRPSRLTVFPLLLASLVTLSCLPLRVQAQATRRHTPPRNKSRIKPEHRFAKGHAAFAIPFENSNNLIFMQVRVNESEPLWFILDTGASYTVVKQKRAQSLGLKLETKASEFEGQPFAKNVRLSLPGVELFNQTIVAAPTAMLEPSVGRAVDGVLGYDFFRNFVVEIDYTAQLIHLYEPAAYTHRDLGQGLPITIEDRTPFVRLQVIQPEGKSYEGKFMIDTGANSALNIFGGFDNAHGISKSTPKLLQTSSVGVSGRRGASIGRLNEIKLGSFRIKNPIVSFAPVRSDSDDLGDGEIGGELLRRFKVIIDYSLKRIVIEPRVDLAEPFEASLSGAGIAAEGVDYKTFKVRAVIENSPASEAGLRAGDIITKIDNKPASEFTFEQLRKMFRQEGREYLLEIKRDDKTQQVKLKLRRLI